MFKFVVVSVLLASAFADANYLRPVKNIYNGRPDAYGSYGARPVKRVPSPAAAPAPRPQPQRTPSSLQQNTAGPAIAILRHDILMEPTGYQYAYETQNGISGQEQASIKPTGVEQAQKSAQGSFSWTSPEGEQISITYIADENGYQPQGSHIPTPPPIPPEIQRALEYIAANPPQPEKTPARRY